MGHSSVNGIVFQFLHVKIVAIIFVILMFFILVFFAQQFTYSQICPRNLSIIYQEYSSVFQVGH